MKSATLDQVKQEQAIMTVLWKIYMKYKFIKDDSDWDRYTKETDALYLINYKGTEFEMLYREQLLVYTKQLERNMKNAI